MNKPKLVICDIDATLVVKHKTLTERAKKAIQKLREKGVYFGIASGRPLYQIRENIKEWGYDDFDCVIGLNGGSVWDGIHKKEYSFYPMKKEWLKETYELMKDFPTEPSLYRDGKEMFLRESTLSEIARNFYANGNVSISEGLDDFLGYDTGKIMYRLYKEEDMPPIEAWVKNHPNKNWVGFKTGPVLIEFCDKNCNKGFGTKEFCRLNNIDLADVIAFGDTSNDNEMLEIAGTGVCMLNGSDDTKAVADIITDKICDDDGWADFIETHVLPLFE
ncbi:MAG: HAD family hydrolase [Bacillota bacterium]|nr:HAD family hydrolase [Bacillota bacterium]